MMMDAEDGATKNMSSQEEDAAKIHKNLVKKERGREDLHIQDCDDKIVVKKSLFSHIKKLPFLNLFLFFVC